MKSGFATLGDASANVSVASFLTYFDHAFDLRSGEDVAFGHLRQPPAVLIGSLPCFPNEPHQQLRCPDHSMRRRLRASIGGLPRPNVIS